MNAFKHEGLEKLGYFFDNQTRLRQTDKPDQGFLWRGEDHYDLVVCIV